jgi:hypothetical protein
MRPRSSVLRKINIAAFGPFPTLAVIGFPPKPKYSPATTAVKVVANDIGKRSLKIKAQKGLLTWLNQADGHLTSSQV